MPQTMTETKFSPATHCTEAVPDRIIKTIDLKAPVARVWQALTDHREFGRWFRVALDGPFVAGEAEPAA